MHESDRRLYRLIVRLSVSLCVHITLSVFLSVSLFLCLSVSVYLCLCLCLCLSLSLSLCLSLSVSPSVCVSLSQFLCLWPCHSLSVCLSLPPRLRPPPPHPPPPPRPCSVGSCLCGDISSIQNKYRGPFCFFFSLFKNQLRLERANVNLAYNHCVLKTLVQVRERTQVLPVGMQVLCSTPLPRSVNHNRLSKSINPLIACR